MAEELSLAESFLTSFRLGTWGCRVGISCGGAGRVPPHELRRLWSRPQAAP